MAEKEGGNAIMSKITIHKFIEDAASGVALSHDEKLVMQERIVTYMEFRPMRKSLPIASEKKYSTLHFLKSFTFRSVPAVVIAGLVLSGAGVSYAAEDSLPGDFLYPVKVDFNEEIVSWVTADPIERAVWEAARTERRLSEVGSLAKAGLLDSGRIDVATERFAEQAKRTAERVAMLSAKDPFAAAEVSAELESALEIHEIILARLAVETDDPNAKVIASEARGQAKKIAHIREEAESAIVADETEVIAMAPQAMSLKAAMPAEGDLAATSEADEVSDSNDAPPTKEEETARTAAARMRSAALRALSRLDSGDDDSENVATIRTMVEADIQNGDSIASSSASEAYRSYRNALSRASRASRLLAADAQYELVLPIEEVVGAVLDTNSSDSSENENGTAEERSHDEEEATSFKVQAEHAIASLTATEAALLAKGKVIAEVESVIRQAQTYLIRGDIAFSSKDFKDAARLYEQAAVTASAEIEETDEEPTTDNKKNNSDEASVPREGDLLGNVIKHSYFDGAHIYSGVVKTPSPCHVADAQARVAESYPEQITVEVLWKEVGGRCIQTTSEKQFLIRIPATQQASLGALLIDGEKVEDLAVEEIDLEAQNQTEAEIQSTTSEVSETSSKASMSTNTGTGTGKILKQVGNMLKAVPGF